MYRYFIILISFLLIGLTACSSNTKPSEPGEGSVTLKISASESSFFAQIASSGFVEISASDMDTLKEDVEITGTSVEGTFLVPTGEDRRFEVSIFNDSGTLVYSGFGITDVTPEQTTDLNIDLFRVGGTVEINGTVYGLMISGIVPT